MEKAKHTAAGSQRILDGTLNKLPSHSEKAKKKSWSQFLILSRKTSTGIAWWKILGFEKKCFTVWSCGTLFHQASLSQRQPILKTTTM